MNDRAECCGIEFIFTDRSGRIEMTVRYRGEPLGSGESIRALLSLYDVGKIVSEGGVEMRFEGSPPREFERVERLGYSTNNVIATERMVIKNYRFLGSREPELMLALQGLVPRVLGFATYGDEYIQIITSRLKGEDLGNLVWENRQRYLSGEDWKDELRELLLSAARRVGEMHLALKRMGEESITSRDIESWRRYTGNLAVRAGISINADFLYATLEGKRKFITHQDLHFGQMMIHEGRIFFVDLEGEPSHSLGDMLPGIRDVATLARALGYISKGAWDEWERFGTRVLYEGYSQIFGDYTEREYLEWMLQRALYEVCYEMEHRREMVDIPLRSARILAEELGVVE